MNNLGYEDFYSANLGDAGLKFLTHQTTLNIARSNKLERCQVITLGTVAWSSQQKTRTDLEVVEINDENFHNYQISRDHLPDKTIQGKEGGFIVSSFAREIIAENLARGLHWWSDFSTTINTSELFQRITYEREGLYNMIQDAQWNEKVQVLFVETCHEALRKSYGKTKGKLFPAQKEDTPLTQEQIKVLSNYFNRNNERFRSELSRCKNAEKFRQFITDFWARSGKISILQEPEQWKAIMFLITDEKKWKMARDLTLLALVSYKKSDKENSEKVFDE